MSNPSPKSRYEKVHGLIALAGGHLRGAAESPDPGLFEALAQSCLREAASRLGEPKPRARMPVPPGSSVSMMAALAAENISVTTFGIMEAIASHGESPPSLAIIAVELGMSYHAVHKALERSDWFRKIHMDLVRLEMTEEAVAKLARIHQRLNRAPHRSRPC